MKVEEDTMLITEQEMLSILEKSKLFDEKFYLEQYPEIRDSGMDALSHYVAFGHREKRVPNRYFSDEKYVEYFGDSLDREDIPFLHYILNNSHVKYLDKGYLKNFSFDVIELMRKRLNKLPFFSENDYFQLNNDTKSSHIPPDLHAIIYGISEGRRIFSPNKISEVFGFLGKETINYSINENVADISGMPGTIGIFHHTKGNCYIREIAEDLTIYLKEAGLNAFTCSEKIDPLDKPDLCIFCAPHEFFFLDGSEDWKKEEILSSSIVVNTEQAQTLWFTRGLIYMLQSAAIIDFSWQNVNIFSEMGIPTFHFDPIISSASTPIFPQDKTHSLFRVLPDSAKKYSKNIKSISQRNIDVCFFGNESKKREKFFSRNAEFFSKKETFIYYRKKNGPVEDEGIYNILGRLPLYVAENSKICLNIHRDENSYFEWHRIVKQGIARGAIVVSEECLPHPLYREGENFFVETPRHMPNIIEWLLMSKDGQKRMVDVQEKNLALFQNNNLKKSKYNDISSFIISNFGKR